MTTATKPPYVRDGEVIHPRMADHGGYQMECCGCGIVHRLDFSIGDRGLELRVYRVEPTEEE
jgi:hypothetical protein